MSIKYIAYSGIDFDRWDHAIDNAANGLPYAYSWYLDVVTNKSWDAMVLGNYEFVMPLPFNRKLFGYHQVYQPILSQQLGLFGKTEAVHVLPQFMEAIPKKFRKIHTCLNFACATDFEKRCNLILPLRSSHDELSKGFSSSLRKNLRKLTTYRLEETFDLAQTINLYKSELEEKVKFGSNNYETATALFGKAMSKGKAKLYSVFQDDVLVASGVFLLSHNRIINVFGASRSDIPGGMAFLISEVIRTYQSSDFLFDFEGSQIPGVRSFFESFGSIEQKYPVFERNTLPFWIKLIRP